MEVMSASAYGGGGAGRGEEEERGEGGGGTFLQQRRPGQRAGRRPGSCGPGPGRWEEMSKHRVGAERNPLPQCDRDPKL